MRRAMRLAVAVLTMGAFAPACSHEIESPGPSADEAADKGILPDLACNATPVSGPFTTIKLHGSNMTPMPTKTLEDKRELVLPKVELTMVAPIAGDTTAAGTVIAITDDPASPATSRVKWTSESEMAFEIHEADKQPTGQMTVKVTNPDGQKTFTFAKNLAIVPKPSINQLMPGAICTDQADSEIVINGDNLLFYKDATGKQFGPSVKISDKSYDATPEEATCTAVPGTYRETDVKLCKTARFIVKKGDFVVDKKTKYSVTIVNPAPADCQSSEPIEITVNPPPKVSAVVPATICEGGSTLTVSGEGFEPGAKVIISCPGGKRIESSSATVKPDGTQVVATFGPGATPGETCEVIVQNPDQCEDRPLPHKTVTVTTGPIVFYVDPPVVYNGVNTQITVFATTIAGDPEISIVPTGTTMPETVLVDTAVTGKPNRRQATIPTGQGAGVYDLKLKDSTACSAILPKAVTVVSDLTVSIKNVVPPFGWTGEDTAVTVFRDTAAAAPKNKPFLNGARLFLNPSTTAAGDVAVPLVGVSFLDGDRLTGTVPKGTAVKKYDMIVVNPDGTVGLLKNAYDELTAAPPVIATANPSSLRTGVAEPVILAGKNFDPGATFTATCVDAAGMQTTGTVTKGTVTATTANVTVTVSAAAGAACVIRITNPDGAYFDFSALGVTTSSFNLSTPRAGTALNTGRRALSSAAGDATTSQRFVYAIGGDPGTPAGALSTYEFAPVDLFGRMGAWTTSPVALADKRTLAGSTTVGRYIYNIGGDLGAGPTETAERALILSPLETPEITDVDLALEMAGLDEGFYQYRVSATFAATDTDNPGGESLASDVFSIRVPAFTGKKVPVTLIWRKPVDSLGAPLAGISGYKIYRTAKDGGPASETLLDSVTGADTLLYKDNGSKTPGADKPLPLGSTGAWLKLPNMATKRSSPSVAAAWDPTNPTTTFYVYAIMGKTGATTAAGTYEYLPVTVAANGRQTVGAWTAGTGTNAVPRSEAGIWVTTSANTTLVTGNTTWIYVGSGKAATGTLNGAVDAAQVQAGGALGAWNTTPKDFTADHAGYGVCAANNRLYVFGGQGAAPSAGAKAAIMISPVPTLDTNSWNNEGLSMTHPRYLHGSSVQSAFIFLLGGQTDVDTASKTTETVIW